jgi:thiamine-monophosphate kinase
MDENTVLERIFSRPDNTARTLAGHGVSLGIGDDAALFKPKRGYETVLTCDWFLEGTHFLSAKHPPDAVGWKCLARALSDIAAMGGTPRCFLLSLALPETHTRRWLELFLLGVRRASRKFRCALAGGDTTRREEILINITVVGEVLAGRAVLRSGARPGDAIYVSGRLGESELGLQIGRGANRIPSKRKRYRRKHLYPEPRLSLGHWLASRGLASAMMDLSDGLSSDLPRLCTASGVGARLRKITLPLVPALDVAYQHKQDPVELALHGGDDYELLFTVPPAKAKLLPKTFKGVSLTCIGKISRNRELLLLDENGRASQVLPGGWDPFRERL